MPTWFKARSDTQRAVVEAARCYTAVPLASHGLVFDVENSPSDHCSALLEGSAADNQWRGEWDSGETPT
jgi:hypothetical protein